MKGRVIPINFSGYFHVDHLSRLLLYASSVAGTGR